MRDNIETNYLIFVSSDGKKTGLDIFHERIKKNKWPIYNRTPQLLNVSQGKHVVFYIAGSGNKRQSFVANGKIKNVIEKATFSYIRQRRMLGLGHAILTAEPLIGNEAFAVALADDLCDCTDDSVISQMVKIY